MKKLIHNKHGLGWVRDLPDHRDFLFAAPVDTSALPVTVDLRPQMPPVWDQGQLGACTAHATSAQFEHIDHTNPFDPSRLFVYFNTRVIENTVNEDSGASIRDSVKSVVNAGVAPSSLWPYDVTKFTQTPPRAAFDAAKKEKALAYYSVVQKLDQFRAVLAKGQTINFGFSVYASFESSAVSKTGIITLPGPREELLGGHAVLVVGYDMNKKWVIVRNSWSTGWGDNGYFYMPFDYILNPKLASDFWTISSVQ